MFRAKSWSLPAGEIGTRNHRVLLLHRKRRLVLSRRFWISRRTYCEKKMNQPTINQTNENRNEKENDYLSWNNRRLVERSKQPYVHVGVCKYLVPIWVPIVCCQTVKKHRIECTCFSCTAICVFLCNHRALYGHLSHCLWLSPSQTVDILRTRATARERKAHVTPRQKTAVCQCIFMYEKSLQWKYMVVSTQYNLCFHSMLPADD